MNRYIQLTILSILTVILYSSIAWGITAHTMGMRMIGIATLALFAVGVFVGKVIFECDK